MCLVPPNLSPQGLNRPFSAPLSRTGQACRAAGASFNSIALFSYPVEYMLGRQHAKMVIKGTEPHLHCSLCAVHALHVNVAECEVRLAPCYPS